MDAQVFIIDFQGLIVSKLSIKMSKIYIQCGGVRSRRSNNCSPFSPSELSRIEVFMRRC